MPARSWVALMRLRSLSYRYRMALGAFVAVVLAAIVTIWHFNGSMHDQIEDLGAANSDSTQWFLAQSEVELLALRNATLAMQVDEDSDLDELRNRFNILFSRINTIEYGRNFAGLREVPSVAEALRRVKAEMTSVIPLIDGQDTALRQTAPELRARFDSLTPDLRTISLEGVRHFSQAADAQRSVVSTTLDELFGIILLLFIILAGGLLFLFVTIGSVIAQRDSITWARNRLHALFETSIDAVVVADQNGIIRNFNSSAERIYGYTRAEAIGADIRELLTPPERMEAVQALLERMRLGQSLPVANSFGVTQSRALHKKGHTIPVEVSVSFNADRDGQVLVAYVRDVTNRVEAEAELIEARDRALEGERAKARMIAVMNHEMRTPLNGILGTLDLMRREDLTETQGRYLSAMQHSAQLLLQHVNSALDASRENQKEITLTPTAFDPAELIRDLLESLSANATQRGNRLQFEAHGADQQMLLGDVGKIRQIVVNLVGNAIKFTENGLITVQLDRIGHSGRIELQVSDTGSGIAEEDLDRIFDEFVTLGSFYDRKAEGTGLGLAIVKRLVEAMGGEIDVVSELGEGTAFIVTLPLETAQPDDAAPARETTPTGAKIRHDGSAVLVVDDNEINRLVAREMLKTYGCTVTEAADGLEGVRQAQERAFDLILMDISMPRLNGMDATQRIRTGGGANVATPVIALTAHALPEDIARFREAGMNDALIKPLDRPALEAMLHDHLPDAAQPATDEPRGELHDLLGAAAASDLLARVQHEIAEGLDLMSRAPSDMSSEDLARLAHKMAGSAAVIGEERLRQDLAALETGFRGADTSEAREKIRKDASLLRERIDCTTLRITA
ncbi:ATP-binding protein [Paracoccus indicus]|uniref:ATP-binding protein n=1 Tax=Paracoccus indicus TaxID=2079229 RepID=UPI000D3520D7|nr:ATP-binding protein [Paracoccus indicus]